MIDTTNNSMYSTWYTTVQWVSVWTLLHTTQLSLTQSTSLHCRGEPERSYFEERYRLAAVCFMHSVCRYSLWNSLYWHSNRFSSWSASCCRFLKTLLYFTSSCLGISSHCILNPVVWIFSDILMCNGHYQLLCTCIGMFWEHWGDKHTRDR